MSGVDRIVQYFEEFCAGLKRCQEAETFVRADLLDVYERLARLRERFIFEKEHKTLTNSEEHALSKVFQKDTFMKGLMNTRTIGAHVTQRSGEPVLYTRSNTPMTITASSSAMAVFSEPVVTLIDKEGRPGRVDHLERLLEAQRRIKKVLDRAQQE